MMHAVTNCYNREINQKEEKKKAQLQPEELDMKEQNRSTIPDRNSNYLKDLRANMEKRWPVPYVIVTHHWHSTDGPAEVGSNSSTSIST